MDARITIIFTTSQQPEINVPIWFHFQATGAYRKKRGNHNTNSLSERRIVFVVFVFLEMKRYCGSSILQTRNIFYLSKEERYALFFRKTGDFFKGAPPLGGKARLSLSNRRSRDDFTGH